MLSPSPSLKARYKAYFAKTSSYNGRKELTYQDIGRRQIDGRMQLTWKAHSVESEFFFLHLRHKPLTKAGQCKAKTWVGSQKLLKSMNSHHSGNCWRRARTSVVQEQRGSFQIMLPCEETPMNNEGTVLPRTLIGFFADLSDNMLLLQDRSGDSINDEPTTTQQYHRL